MRKFWKTFTDYLPGEVGIFFLAYIWYDNLLWMGLLQALLIPYTFFMKNLQRKRRKRQYEKGFYDFLQSLLPSLQAGYSLENACITAYKELSDLNGKKHPFVQCLESVVGGIRVHISVEELFYEMAIVTENEDIHEFAVVLEILKNMGGNSVEVLRNSMLRIQKKMETGEEIRTLLSGKIYEKNLMLLMPFLMILYLRITNGAYLQPLYHSLAGQCVMTVSLLAILACFYWTEQIMKISY